MPDGSVRTYRVFSGAPAYLAEIDTFSGEVLRMITLHVPNPESPETPADNGAQGAWGVSVDRHGTVFASTYGFGHVYRLPWGAAEIEDLGRPAPYTSFTWEGDVDDDGNFYFGTTEGFAPPPLPGGRLFGWNAETRTFHDYGDFGDTFQYVRSVEYADGKIYAGLGQSTGLWQVGRAAEQLGLSTTRVSQTIRGLERRVGAPLFERTSRVVRLTPLGERLRADLLPLHQQLDRVWREIREAAGAGAVLTVGLSASVPDAVRSGIERVMEAERGDRLAFVPVNPLDVFLWDEQVEIGLDAVVGWLPPGAGRRVTRFLSAGPVIRRSPPALVVGVRHPFAGRESVHVEDLAETGVLVAHSIEALVQPWVPATTPAGRPIRLVRRDVRYLERLPAELAGGDVAHLTMLEFARSLPANGTVVVPLIGRAPFECRLIWPTSRETAAIRTLAGRTARVAADGC